jgi:hypothetical protein
MKIKVAALSLLLTVVSSFPALAANDPTRLFLLQIPITLNGVEVPKGVYDFTVDSDKSNVKITLKKQGRVIATAPGTLVKTGVTPKSNLVLLSVNPDGSRALYEIRLAGSQQAIMLDETATIAQLKTK